MSTNSTITVRTASNERKSIYCHWDGYPSYNGLMLLEHYNTLAKAKALVELGWLSVLNENIVQPKGEVHTFDKPYKNVNVYYGRDRGEDDVECKTLKNSESIDEQEYNYLFKDGKWFVDGRVLTLEMCNDETTSHEAVHFSVVKVIDPNTKGEVELSVFKDDNSGGIFAIDSSYLEQNFEDDEPIYVQSPFNSDIELLLKDTQGIKNF